MIPLELDELHSVSDLHIGGESGRQIFAGTAELAGLIDSLREKPADRRVALVVNGDFIDFLAEPNASPFDPDGAARKLANIQGRAEFAPIFDALRRFVATPGRLLGIVIGNHDLELALPDVREELLRSLSAGDEAARGRVLLSMDGTGFAARVGGARVMCVHGNDVDAWNATDYEFLRRLARDRQMGRAVDAWTPNAGSKMVIEVMNGIKRELPFVDLLKPETEAVVPILLALDQGTAARLRGVMGVAARVAKDMVRRRFGLLGADEQDALGEGAEPHPFDLLVQRRFAVRSDFRSSSEAATALLELTEARLREGVDPMSLAGSRDQNLGLFGAALDLLRGRSKVEILREAIEGVQKDKSFDPTVEDGTFQQLDQQVGPEVDFVIAGHTHLERSLARRRGSGHYFNTGTWARLIRIRPEQLADEESFEPVFAALRSPTIPELDESGMVMRLPAVASVWREGGATRGALRRVQLGTGGIELEPIGAEGGS